jgi:hypothetical protein
MAITGVAVLPGIEVPSAERSLLIMRPYPEELQFCKRYGQSSYPDAVLPAANTPLGMATPYAVPNVGNSRATVAFPVEFRAVPTLIGRWDAVGNVSRISAWDGGNTQTETFRRAAIVHRRAACGRKV